MTVHLAEQVKPMNLKELQERYGITRTPLYARIKSLNLTLSKDSNNQSIADEEQVLLLDELDQHLKSGGNLNNFLPQNKVTVLSVTEHEQKVTEHDTLVPVKITPPDHSIEERQLDLFEDLFDLGMVIASKIKSPLENLKDLELAYQNGWLLDKSQLRQLLNKQKLPSKEFSYYGFKFTPVGKFWEVGK